MKSPEQIFLVLKSFQPQSNNFMNTNRTTPLNAARASAVVFFGLFALIGLAIFCVVKSFFPDKKDAGTRSKIAPADTATENTRKVAEITREIPAFRSIAPEIPAVAPILSAPREIIPQPAVPTAHKIISQVFAAAVTTHPKSVLQPAPPPPIKKPGISWDDMAKVFRLGALTRQAAVAELRKLGFGQTAAYAALLPDGRFSTWLYFAPDGTITWNS